MEKIFSTYSPDELSYFEMNLETWRQLWRVLEMSDIILMIVDIRYPVRLDTCIYTIVDLFCANEFFRAISHWKWSPRCEMRWEVHFEHNIHVSMIVCLSNNSYTPITNTSSFVNYKKGALDSQPHMIKFTSCLSMDGGSLRVLRLPPPLKLVAMI